MSSPPGTVPLASLFGRRDQPPADQGGFNEQQMIKFMQSAFESCPTKMVMAGTMGFALGGAFGLFTSSMRYDLPSSMGPNSATGALADLPIRQQLKAGLKDMGRTSFSSAKNFGMVGAIFSGVECCIEGMRGKNDLANGVAGGCVTGGILAAKAGPQAAALGCAGFAAFSLAIDSYMRMPSEGTGGKIE